MQRNIEAQPRGLFLLFFTELWERFGFYTLQTIIVLYLSKALLFTDEKAYLLYGTFSSLLYMTPVFGGYLADRFIGFRQSINLGGILLFLGYLFLAVSGTEWLFTGLSLVIVGNGLFKPNVSSIVGELYGPEDPRRDGGFTLFYMGINIGALVPPLIAGAIISAYSWSAGFFLAAIGMGIGMVTFWLGRHRLGHAGGIPSISPLHKGHHKKWVFYMALLIGIVLATVVFHLLLKHPREADWILAIGALAIIGMVLYYLIKERPEQRRKLWACLILILISVGFWSLYNQTFTSMMLFADRNMSKEFLGFTIDAEFTQFFNPFFIILLSPFLSWLWVRLDRDKLNPTTPSKFSLGILFMAVGYLVLGGATYLFPEQGMSSPWWLVLSYFFQTVGELLLSPIGLAMITRLSPRHLVGMMMGVWFLVQSASFAIGGGLATIADVPTTDTVVQSLSIYSGAFLIFGVVSVILAIISFCLVPYLKKLMESPHHH
ncbi:MAG: MFS transporter [Verrucomicrobia bacterium]|nr:MFS transporter [Verrucomicrobiota bacterium]